MTMVTTFLTSLQVTCPRLLAKARVQTDRVSGQPVLLYPEGVLLLNATGAAIIRLCDGTQTFAEILALLASSYQTSAESLAQDVGTYLHQLYQHSLIELVAVTDPSREKEANPHG